MQKFYSKLFIGMAATMLVACGNANNASSAESEEGQSDSIAIEAVETVTDEVNDSTLTENDLQGVYDVLNAIHTQRENKQYAAPALRKKISDGYHSIGIYDYGTDGLTEWEVVPNSLKITSFDPTTGSVKYSLKVKCQDTLDGGEWEDVHEETARVVKEEGNILVAESSTLYWWS